MTQVPPGAQLAPIDLPPPHPAADPREPSPTTGARRGSRTPVKARSPAASRSTSPARPTKVSPGPDPISLPNLHQATGTNLPQAQHAASPPRLLQLHQPSPRAAGSSGSPVSPQPGISGVIDLAPLALSAVPHHRLSRPSSPASVHSSTSAIFERDIEHPTVALSSLTLNPVNNQTLSHKSSRLLSHGSALDHSVPAVLDDAVEALSGGTSRGIAELEIEAPVLSATGMVRQQSAPISHIHHAGRKISAGPTGGLSLSRSPSPSSVQSQGSSSITSPIKTPQNLSQITTGAFSSGSEGPSPTATRPPMAERMSTGPLLPGGWGFKDELAEPPLASIPEPSPPVAIPSHLTPNKEKRRISYISYNDLLLSVPTQVTQLNEITSGHLSPEHLPGTVSPGLSSRSPILQSGSGAIGSPVSGAEGGVSHKPSWEAGSPVRLGGLGLGTGQGEWGREGLGRGLEQRLEDLAQVQGTAQTR